MSIKDLPRWLLPAALGAAVVVVLLIVLLGGDDDATAEGPASIVPADAPLYVDVSLKPEGEAKDAADAALGQILDTDDPGAKVISLIEDQAAEEGDEFDYEQDIEPWLGEHFAVYLTRIGGEGESEGGFVIETSDADQALEFIESQGDEGDEAEERSYEGVSYTVDEGGDAFGVVGDFLVGGDEASFKAAVDTNQGDSLAESDEFTEAVDGLDSDRLATLYVPVREFLDAVAADEDLDPQARELLEGALGDAADEPVLGQLTASATDVTVELSAGGGDVQTEESSLLESLPADTWLALGIGDVGAAVDRGIDSLNDAGVDADTIKAQVLAQTGIELDALTAALGEAAFFVRGTTVADLGGALIIQDKDPTVTNLLGQLQGLIKQQAGPAAQIRPVPGAEAGFEVIDPSGQLPKPIQVVQASGKIVAGYGADSVQQAAGIATAPKSLEQEPAFSNAREAVGDLGVDAFLAFAPIIALAEEAGAGADPDFQAAKPYLEGIESIAVVGSGSQDGRAVLRFIVGLN